MKSTSTHSKVVRKRVPVAPAGVAPRSGDEERLARIAVSAYYKAQARGFAPGQEMDDWLAAEHEEASCRPH